MEINNSVSVDKLDDEISFSDFDIFIEKRILMNYNIESFIVDKPTYSDIFKNYCHELFDTIIMASKDLYK